MENKELKKYESVIILRKENYENSLERVKNYIKNIIDIENIEEKGLKKLAYEVNNNKEGYYVVIYFKSVVENISELERFFRINDDILKFIIMRADD